MTEVPAAGRRRDAWLRGARPLQAVIAMTTTGIAPGARIGDYILGPAITGGAGELVFDAAHVVLPRQVRLVIAADPDVAAVRLLRSACIVEALRHPGVPRVFECGRLADRRPWIAIERVVGPTLAALVAAGPLAPDAVLAMVRELAAALALAHARGVLHGGLTADRVVRGDAGWVIADWTTAAPGALALPADVHALGALAARAVGDDPAGRLGGVLARMLDLDPAARPSCAALVAELAAPPRAHGDDSFTIEEEEVVLIDISHDPPPAPRQARARWTPEAAYQAPPGEPRRADPEPPRKPS